MAGGLSSAIGASTSSAISYGARATKNAFKSGQVSGHGLARGMGTLNSETKQGRSLGAAAIKGAASYVGYASAPHLMYGMDIARTAVQGADTAIEFRKRRAMEIGLSTQHATIGGGFQDSMQAQTMRQAAVQQIQANKMNARSALGGEARIFSNKRHNQHTRPYL